MPSNKLIPNVEYQAHQVGTTTKFQDGMLVTRRRQLEKDKFKRRYNVSYVLDGKFHYLVEWETCYNSRTSHNQGIWHGKSVKLNYKEATQGDTENTYRETNQVIEQELYHSTLSSDTHYLEGGCSYCIDDEYVSLQYAI